MIILFMKNVSHGNTNLNQRNCEYGYLAYLGMDNETNFNTILQAIYKVMLKETT
jgi:hypothetical protein